MVKDDGEGSGLPGECHRAPRNGIESDVVPTIRQVDPMQKRSRFRQYRRAVAAVAPLVGRSEHGVRLHRFGERAARQGCEETGARGLQEIPGVGPNRKRALLRHFGTLAAIERASLTDLETVPGINAATAKAVYDYFHANG
jgi:hypothetical protein